MSWWMILILVWLAPAVLASLGMAWSVISSGPREPGDEVSSIEAAGPVEADTAPSVEGVPALATPELELA